MQFVFVTAISISISETQGKLTQYQHHRKKNNGKILLAVDQPLADLDQWKNSMERYNSMKSRSKK